MKNKSLLLFLLVFSQWSFSQTFTTGVVNLSSTAGLTMSVKLDISTNVTMTLTGPSGRWFALGFGASSMAAGTDVVGVHALGSLPNFDANLTGNNAPATDTQQDWTITSDQVAAGVRTIIATRALNTGDANDYAFSAATGTLSLIWARGSSNSFAYSGHGGTNRGVVTATFTEVQAPPLTISSSNSTICSGSSTTLTANSTAGVSYLWSPGGQTTASITVSPISTTTYSCTATENGASTTVNSVITVNPTPTINTIPNTSFCNGLFTSTFTFSGTPGATYTWTNSNLGIGLPSSGTGNIAPFQTPNTITTLTTGTIVVTPTLNGCSGTPLTFDISINPTPSIYQFDLNYCHGEVTTPVVWQNGLVAANNVIWTNSNTSIGLGASGTGTVPSFTANNLGTNHIAATINATPQFVSNGVACSGSPFTIFYYINPLPSVTNIPDISICNGDTLNTISFSGIATSFEWTNSQQSIGIPASGIGNINSFVPQISSGSSNSALITVTPQYFFYIPCFGAPDTFLITVSTTLSSTTNQTACESYIWNGDTLTTSGTYTAEFSNSGGCDSLANLNLIIENAPMTPIISVSNGNQFSILPSSIQSGVNYQWVICPELIAIDGANDTIFVPSDNGEYAVVATNSCGSVTSDCYLSTVSVLNTEIEKYKVYPTILSCGELLHLPSSKTYNLYDLQGNLICSISESIMELRMDFPAGLYLLKNEGETIKIVLTN
jgi:hypothetical protein